MENQPTYNTQPMPPQGPMMPLPRTAPRPMSRRARWGRRLMTGNVLVKQSLPEWFATFAVGTYAVALIGVNLLFSSYAMEWYFWLFGIAWVAGFFFLSVKFSQDWSILHVRRTKAFERKLFWTGLAIRAVYAIFIYFFYLEMTGEPYEFAAADAKGYVELAQYWSECWSDGYGKFHDRLIEASQTSFSDMGYPLLILLPIRIFEGNFGLLIVRFIHAFFGASTAVIIYRLVRRSMGEIVARLAAIFCMLHPVLICYVGVTLKEIFMTWLLVLFIDLVDRMLIERKYTFATIAPLVFAGLGLFMFRTVLGLVAIMAVFFALVMIDTKIVNWGKKVVLGIVLVGAVMLGASDNIMREVNIITETDVQKQQEISMTKRYGSEKSGELSGNSFADYAGAGVFAPLIFTIPFPTMVDIGFQEDMRLIHGGNWMRNIMSGFVILAMFMLLLSGDWRKYTLTLAMLLGYLLMLAFTSFAHSLRFHIPVIPFEMLFAAYAITNLRRKHKNWYLIWCIFIIVTCFAWNWMKLRGRGIA